MDAETEQLLKGCPYKDDPEFHSMLKESFEERIRQDALEADRQLTEAAQVVRRNGVRALPFGHITMQMPVAAYVHYRVKERADLGSREDRKILAKLHPAMAVKSGRNKLGVGWAPAGSVEIPVKGNVKFRKVYCQPAEPRKHEPS
jgi:hypothetical protein